MFNFTLVNKALTDETLSDLAFRVLYLIGNKMSLDKSDEIEIYDDFLVEKLNRCRRSIQYATAELSEKGYITKEYGKKVGNKKPIKIKVGAKYCTDSQKVGVTGDTELESGCKNLQKVDAKNCTLYNSTCTKYSSMDQKNKPSGDEIRKYNEYIDNTFRTLQQKLNFYYTLTTSALCDATDKELTDIFKDAQEKKHYFTDAQWEKLCRYGDRWVKIRIGKTNYFNSDKAKTGMTSVEDDEPQEYNEIQSNISYLGEDSESAAYGFTG